MQLGAGRHGTELSWQTAACLGSPFWRSFGPSLEAAVGIGCSDWVSWAPAEFVASCQRAQGQNVVSEGLLDVKIIWR